MSNTIFSQTMRTTAYQTWNIKQSFSHFDTKATVQVMFEAGSIVGCGNSANNPLLDPRSHILIQ